MALSREKLARCRSANAVKSGKLKRAKSCQRCGARAMVDGHHEDYSKPLDITWLCRRCHMIVDGRMAGLHKPSNYDGRRTSPTPCSNCQRPSKPLRRGLCHVCNEYARRQGKPRPYKRDGRIEKGIPARGKPCARCGRRADRVGRPVKGMCLSCYTTVWRRTKRKEAT